VQGVQVTAPFGKDVLALEVSTETLRPGCVYEPPDADVL
jgi:hypothetical protein